LNLLVHSRELSYHANYGAANGHPEYKDYLRTLMKHVNRICILGQAHQNRPMYTEINNLQFERLNSWNGANVGIPIFTDSTVKTIDFDTSFGWDYIHLAINFFNDEGRENYKFSPCIKNIRFPSDAKVISVRVEFYDHTGELYHGDDGIEWEVAENSWLETLDLPANAWKCDIRMPINTLKNVYLPTNPDVLKIANTLIHSPFKKANHINYRRSIHNGLEFNYNLYSASHTICDRVPADNGAEGTELYKIKNVVETLNNGNVTTTSVYTPAGEVFDKETFIVMNMNYVSLENYTLSFVVFNIDESRLYYFNLDHQGNLIAYSYNSDSACKSLKRWYNKC
jgi:hypothetical protein